MCGVDIQSQAAYELAVKGLIRPSRKEIPVVYGIKCIEFKLPDFVIGKSLLSHFSLIIFIF